MDHKKPSPDLPEVQKKDSSDAVMPREIGGFADMGLNEPTRYGDWDVKGRCSDF
ncbi:MAG: DUF1674 domain-containing protein [Alphaproteobacteria bacterium]|nr:DUF1674 domain-containing protein [Alphaproteobacteria bacterium]